MDLARELFETAMRDIESRFRTPTVYSRKYRISPSRCGARTN
jgi:hypothetical protein